MEPVNKQDVYEWRARSQPRPKRLREAIDIPDPRYTQWYEKYAGQGPLWRSKKAEMSHNEKKHGEYIEN
jgi:hypothetical protein